MQAASTFSVKAKSGFALHSRRIFPSASGSRKNSLAVVSSDLSMTKGNNCFGLGLRLGSMGAGGSIQSIFGSSARVRSVRANASEGDVEDAGPAKIQVKSSGTVLPYVGVACLGAILFGYHLGVVNGALEYLAKDLGIAENTALQGKLGEVRKWVQSNAPYFLLFQDLVK